MFGYIRAFKPELKVREFESYKSVYCGLCRELGRQYGPLARLTLSYDFTFLAMLALSLSQEEPRITVERCPVNPLKRVPCSVGTEEAVFCCDMAALMLWHKLRDDAADDGPIRRLGARLGLLLAAPARKKAQQRQPRLAALFQRQMDRQAALEREGCADVDQACDPTATVLAEIFASLSSQEREKRVLWRLGYLLGRYVYMVDALDDLDQDQKRGSYNPFLRRGDPPEELRSRAKGSLYLTIGEMGTAWQLLEPRRFGPILENILLLGLKNTVDWVALPSKDRPKQRYW